MDEVGEKPVNEDLDFKMGEVFYTPIYESRIPREITDEILSREKLPSEIQMGSSLIEDFIVDKIKNSENISNEQIVDSFFSENYPEKVNNYIREIKETSANLDWEKVFNDRDVSEAQAAVLLEMKALGMTEDQIQAIANVKPEVTEEIGVSLAGTDAVYASRLQAVRRALDYVKVFGEGENLDEATKVLLASTIGHELGHEVDVVAGDAIIQIPNEWKKDGDWVENKGERFAEYWGGIPLTNERMKGIKEKEWLIQLKKTTEVWNAIGENNSKFENKIDLFTVFRGIRERLEGEGKEEITALMNAREIIFSGAEVENYASPYSRDVITGAVKPKAN